MEITNKLIQHPKSQMTSVTDNVIKNSNNNNNNNKHICIAPYGPSFIGAWAEDVYRFVRVTGRG